MLEKVNLRLKLILYNKEALKFKLELNFKKKFGRILILNLSIQRHYYIKIL